MSHFQYPAVIYYRDKLTEHEKKVYDKLVSQWMRMEPMIQLPAGHCDMAKISQAILCDYPLLFYINYYSMSCQVSPLWMRMEGSYLYNIETARRMFDDCVRWGQEAVAQLKPGWSQAKKAMWLYQFLTRRVRYDLNGSNAHNLIGVVQDGRAVCEGIAKAYEFLCDLAGISCILVVGTMNGGNHAWNKIWIDGKSGFVDVTAGLAKFMPRTDILLSAQELRLYEWDRTLVPDQTR